MSDRFELIAQKQEVRRRIEQIQRQLASERLKDTPSKRQIRKLEDEQQLLMAKEYSLRLDIDRSA